MRKCSGRTYSFSGEGGKIHSPLEWEGDHVIPQRTRQGWEDQTALEVNGHRFRFSSLCVKGLGNLRNTKFVIPKSFFVPFPQN